MNMGRESLHSPDRDHRGNQPPVTPDFKNIVGEGINPLRDLKLDPFLKRYGLVDDAKLITYAISHSIGGKIHGEAEMRLYELPGKYDALLVKLGDIDSSDPEFLQVSQAVERFREKLSEAPVTLQ